MKNLRLGSLEDAYGSLLEEVLCEVFDCEEKEEFCVGDIYDLSSEADVQRRLKREDALLNEGSASIENLEELEKQARDYFSNPKKVFVPNEEPIKDFITVFIQFSAGMNFDEKGNAVTIWKSFGQKQIVDTDKLYQPEKLFAQVGSLGIEMNDLVRLVCYGPSLEKFVGTKHYIKGEKKELVELSESYPNIVLAIPDFDEVDYKDDSIFSRVEAKVSESVQFGMEADVCKSALLHWQMTHSRLEEIKLEEAEEKESRRIQALQKKSVEKRNDFDQNFREARDVISKLNSGGTLVKDLFQADMKLLNQIMFLAQKKGERIETAATFFQLKSLIAKKKMEEVQSNSDDQKYLEFIKQVNSGVKVEVQHLSYEELEGVFKILWGNIGIRISSKYKVTYFQLKERYTFLKRLQNKEAA